MSKKAKICNKCGGFLYVSWSDHCTGYNEFVDEDGNGFGDSDITRGEGGTVRCDSSETYTCNECNKEFDDLEGLETKEVE